MSRQRIGNKWTTEEEQQLIQQLQQNKHLAQIAKDHQRTQKAIEMRLQCIIRKLSSSKSMQDIASYLHIDMDTLQRLEQLENPSSTTSSSVLHEQLQDMNMRLQKIEHTMDKLYKKIKVMKS